MMGRVGLRFSVVCLMLSTALALSTRAQQMSDAQEPAPAKGIDVGNYNLHQSIELGYRYTNLTGNQDNYDTLVNLHQGPRLLNYSMDAGSLNHHGALFDTLSFYMFGLGGDPNNVATLRASKNRWYNFDATFRRDKYFFGYNLLANPLNPASSNPSVPITSALHLINESRRMGNYNLTMFPESRVRLRLGYSHVLEEGPNFSSIGASVGPEAEPGVATQVFEPYHTTTDIYHVGVDFNFLPRTRLSYDQYVQHFKLDSAYTDQHQLYQLSNGVPLDLGVVFNTPSTPCPTPIIDATTTPETADPTCSGLLSYYAIGNPRGTMPTERFSFQTSYITNLNMAGQISYSSGTQTTDNLSESWIGNYTRTLNQGTSVGANSEAKRILVQGNWGAVYSITSRFRISDTVDYNAFRIPGYYDFTVTNLFRQPTTGASMLGLSPNQTLTFNPDSCVGPGSSLANCPLHNSSSGADLAQGTRMRFLGQKVVLNTIQLEYQFTPRFGARLGYRYKDWVIQDFDALLYGQEVFLPGGSAGAAAAARGDCSLVNSGQPLTQSNLPDGCVLETSGPLAGAIVFSGLEPGGDTSRNLAADISGHSALLGFWSHPTDKLQANFDMELFSGDGSFTRITPRHLQRYFGRVSYEPRSWAQLSGSVNIIERRDNVVEVQDKEHNRNYNVSAVLTPNQRISFDLAYNYSDIYTQALDCFATNVLASSTSPCPIAGSPVTTGALSIYQSKTHFANADLLYRPVKQVTVDMGYTGSFVRGTSAFLSQIGFTTISVPFLNSLTPYGPLRFNYHQPHVSLAWAVPMGFTIRGAWGYYGYNEKSPYLNQQPPGLAPLGLEDFTGNLATFSVQYSF